MAIKGTQPYTGADDVGEMYQFLKKWNEAELRAVCALLDITYDNLACEDKALALMSAAIVRANVHILYRTICP